jgi:hypothetical protein
VLFLNKIAIKSISCCLRVLAIVLYLLPAQNGEIPPETERKRIKIASVVEGKKTIKMPSVSARSREFRRKCQKKHSK